MTVSEERRSLAYYQGIMEKFYDDLLDVWREGGFKLFAGPMEGEPFVLHPDIELVVFEDILYSDPNDPEPIHELLKALACRGWQITMNFMALDCLLGNVAVKIGDKWFAFGQCRKDEEGEPYVAEIWPLKYVLLNLSKMEVKPSYTFPIRGNVQDSNRGVGHVKRCQV